MASIYIRANSPFYQIRYYDKQETNPSSKRKSIPTNIPITPADYKRHQSGEKILGTPELKRLVKEFKHSLFERNFQIQAKVKLRKGLNFSDGLEEFFSVKPNITKSTERLYRIAAEHFLKICNDREIVTYAGKDYVKLSSYFNEKGYSKTTIAIFYRHLFSIFSYFVKKKYIAENIVIKIYAKAGDPEPIKNKDMQTILNYLEKHNFWQYAFVYYSLLTGMRKSSVLVQKRSDIDLEDKIIRATNVKARNRTFYFPVSDELADLLQQIFLKSENNERLFYMYSVNGDGLKFWPRLMDTLVKGGLIEKKYQLKQLRKTFPSWLATAGVERGILKDLLDHSNIEVTEQHYLKIEAKRYLEDVNKVRFKDEN